MAVTDPTTLQQLAASGLGNYLTGSPQDMENALYDRQAADINRSSGINAQAALENTFGRGVGSSGGGPSSITQTALEPIQRTRNDALLKARNDAFISSQQAQLAALAQAAGTAQNAINSGQANANQQTAFGLQKRGQNFSQGQATNAAVGQGVGGLGGAALGTAGMLYAPQIRKFLGAGAAGAGGDAGKMPTVTGFGGSGPGIQAGPSAADVAGGAGGGAYQNFAPLSSPAASFQPTSFSPGNFDMGGASSALSGLSNFDPSSFDFSGGFSMPTDFDWGSALNAPFLNF